MTLLGISGKKRHGKDSVYEYLAQNAVTPVAKLALADALKEEVACFLAEMSPGQAMDFFIEEMGLDPRSAIDIWNDVFVEHIGDDIVIVDWRAEKKGFTEQKARHNYVDYLVSVLNNNEKVRRRILQKWGTDYRRRKYGDDYWRRQFMERLRNFPKGTLVVCTDLRFPDEVDMAHDLGGKVVRVKRTNYPDDPASQHISETALDNYTNWDYVIEASNLDELHEATEKMAKHYHIPLSDIRVTVE